MIESFINTDKFVHFWFMGKCRPDKKQIITKELDRSPGTMQKKNTRKQIQDT